MTVQIKDATASGSDIEAGSDANFSVGQAVDEVSINIDYAIIKHFSEHLYSSPNKAIEELVSNGFDALATLCYVYVPGDFVQDRVIVWDNGLSMDSDGLQAMWQIARSPKEDLGVGRFISGEGKRRAVIGKFGIGKLASYAVGHRISHLCRTKDGRYLSVSVNYRLFTEKEMSDDKRSDTQIAALEPSLSAQPATSLEELPDSASAEDDRKKTPIRELSKAQADALVRELLPTGAAVEVMLAQPHWTLAVIDDLKDVPLYPARLMWILGNGMPLRPDFKVFVEDKEITPRLASNALTTWDLAEPKLKTSLLTAWKEGVAQKKVFGDLKFEPATEPDPKAADSGDPASYSAAVVFPTMGRVTATVRLFQDSLATKSIEDGRSFGFFLMVRGRLVNPDDEKLFLNDPSFGTFYRSQFQILADGMDADLLADRESLRRDTAMTRELQILQVALYRAARTEVESQDDVKNSAERPESRLPVRSRELFRDPMTALLSRSSEEVGPVDYDEPVIERVVLGEGRPLAEIDPANGHLQVNRSHPFYKVIETQAGGGKKAAATMRAVDLFAVSERLTEGFLYGRGVAEDQIIDLLDWRDKLFRSLAVTYDRNPDDAVLELRASSIPGGDRFELAITNIFNLMGFKATQHGKPGEKDVLVIAPLGPDHRAFIIEAKGSKHPVVNVTAALASAAAHRDAVDGAVHAVVIAREFAGFVNKDEPAILKECEAVKNVSVVTVETLVGLYYALLKYAYPLDSVMDALFAIETPKAKAERVAALDKPLEDFNFREVLDEIWLRQSGEAVKDQVATRALWQSRPAWRDGMTIAAFSDKLAALEHFAGRLMVYDPNEKTVYLRHDPEKVSDHVKRSLAPAFAATLVEIEGSDTSSNDVGVEGTKQ
jgi:hypothetical protein